MAENQSAISDVMQKGMRAANTVKGAVKVGKSIAAAAKGGSAGGWIGAVVAFAWENRRLVAAIIAGSIVIFLMPVIVVSMLPGIIFGDTNNAYSPLDSLNPVLNSPTVITENMENITSSIQDILNEGLTSVMKEVEQDKSTLPKDTNILISYAEDKAIENSANLILSQYCASKNYDYSNISLADLENTLRKNLNKLYRFEKSEEIIPDEVVVTVVNAQTGEETKNIVVVEELYTVYTVFFNGEDYFADNIFKLTDEQKKLANDYLSNLNLYLQGGI